MRPTYPQCQPTLRTLPWICVIDDYGVERYCGRGELQSAEALEPGTWFGRGRNAESARSDAWKHVKPKVGA